MFDIGITLFITNKAISIFVCHLKSIRNLGQSIVKITIQYSFVASADKTEDNVNKWKSKFNGLLGGFCLLVTIVGLVLAYCVVIR